MSVSDHLQRFQFLKGAVRGEICQLDEAYQAVLSRHEYPEAIQHLLGQALAGTALMAANLKFEGSLILQIQGDGPLSVLMVECNHRGEMRGIARYDEALMVEQTNFSWTALAGAGQVILTLDPEEGERYQGIVALEGDSLGEALAGYFEQSEQLPTYFNLAADGVHAGGLMLQVLPQVEESDDLDLWARAQSLAITLKPEELLGLAAEEAARVNAVVQGDGVSLKGNERLIRRALRNLCLGYLAESDADYLQATVLPRLMTQLNRSDNMTDASAALGVLALWGPRGVLAQWWGLDLQDTPWLLLYGNLFFNLCVLVRAAVEALERVSAQRLAAARTLGLPPAALSDDDAPPSGSLVLLRLADLAGINKRAGREMADEVLRRIGSTLRHDLRDHRAEMALAALRFREGIADVDAADRRGVERAAERHARLRRGELERGGGRSSG